MRRSREGPYEGRGRGGERRPPSPPAILPRRERGGCAPARGGAALFAALAAAAIASLLVVMVLKAAVARHARLRDEAARLQAGWLAESGMDRAASRLAADAQYRGETWNLTAESLGARDPAKVQIEVARAPGRPERRAVRVVADYPDDPWRRVRITVEREIDAPEAGERIGKPNATREH